MASTFTAEDYLKEAVVTAASSMKELDAKLIWRLVADGILPVTRPDDRCECIIPTNIERGASPQSTAGMTKVKPTGDVTFALAHVFADRIIFMAWTGLLKTKFQLDTIKYSDIRAVNPVEYRYKMNKLPGLEILHAGGRFPVLGNDFTKIDSALNERWNVRLTKRLTGEWIPTWMEDRAVVERWSSPVSPS